MKQPPTQPAPGTLATHIQDTIEQAFKTAGLDAHSGPMRGVSDTIRQALASAGLGDDRAPPAAGAEVIDVVAREVPDPQGGPTTADRPGRFVLRTHRSALGSLDYKLYMPARRVGSDDQQPLPLVLMLHGCTQSADDFAAGTQMNRLADQHGFWVVYPEQAASANASRCWNWFRAQDQLRHGGEPEMLAGIVTAVSAAHAVDPQRMYVAGLSAGAAMAVVLGETYPELFAAVGAHSGLPYAAAHDIPSAMAAMKGHPVMGQAHLPGTANDPRRPITQSVPVIVFHGDRDHTVQASNGERIAAQAVQAHALKMTLTSTTEQGTASGGRRYTRTRHADASGRTRVEFWKLHGAGHAWSGGHPSGSFTDAAGPDASAEMLRFFLAQTGSSNP